MIDPLSALGLGYEVLGERLIEWAKGGDVQRLFAELDRELDQTAGLSAFSLEPLQRDADFLAALADYSRSGKLNREAMIGAVEPYLDGDEQARRRDAELITSLVDRRMIIAFRSEREALRFAVTRLESQLGSVQAQVMSFDWAPERVREKLARLSSEQSAEAVNLESALSDDPRAALPGLVEHPPGWIDSGSALLWEILGELSENFGLWPAAGQAYLRASDTSAQRVRLLARAAMAMQIGGDRAEGERLLAVAEDLAPTDSVVVFARARTVSDPTTQLEMLRDLRSGKARIDASVAATRALCHIRMKDLTSAYAEAADATSLDARNPIVRELNPTLVLLDNEARYQRGQAADSSELLVAAGEFLSLSSDLLALSRDSEGISFLARASEAYSLAGDYESAANMVEQAIEVGANLSVELVNHLANTALLARRPDLVPPIVGDSEIDDGVRLRLAKAAVDETGSDSVEVFRKLLKSDDADVRLEAALALLYGLAREGAWDLEAGAIVEGHDPTLAAMLQAESSWEQGDRRGAENALLPHSDDQRVRLALIEYALDADEWDKVLRLSEPLMAGDPPGQQRMIHAEALRRNGRIHDAFKAFLAIARNDHLSREFRLPAYRMAIDIGGELDDLDQVLRLLDELLELDPTDSSAVWKKLYTLGRMARWAEARALLLESGVRPATMGQANIGAKLVFRTGSPDETVRYILDALEELGREPDEGLAAILLSASVDATGLGEDEGAFIREYISTTIEAFPDSQMIRSVKAPTTPEEATAFVDAHVRPRAEAVAEVAQAILDGECSTVELALAVNEAVSTIWRRGVMPLEFDDATLRELELRAASAAIGSGAVWDPASTVVVTRLGSAADALRTALPGSVIARATLDDANLGEASADALPGAERRTLGFDLEAEAPVVTTWTGEAIAADLELARGVLVTARQLDAVPNVDSGQPSSLDSAVQSVESSFQAATWVASLSVATRRSLPLYSDDRFLRREARELGIASFGTAALIRALEERGALTPEASGELLESLRAMGGFDFG